MDSEIDYLTKLLSAIRWRQNWLARYLASGGIFYDRTLGRWGRWVEDRDTWITPGEQS